MESVNSNMRRSLVILSVLLLFFFQSPLSARAKGVVLNFNEVDIATLVRFISDLTGKNFILDERVKGKISIFSPAQLSPEEAFNVFTSVLELKGFTLIQAGKIYKIVPASVARQSGMALLTDKDRGPVNEAYVARVIPLENISAQEAVAFLLPIVSKDGYISSFGPANMVLVVDSSFNLQKIIDILHLLDNEQHRTKPEVLFLKNAGAENTALVVREWMKSRDKTVRPAGQVAGGGIVVPDSRLNALIVFGGESLKDEIKKLVALTDVIPPVSSSKINVCYLENADATEVAKVMEGILKGSTVSPVQGAAAAAAPLQQSPFEGGKITITPDKATNSLIVMASPADYQNLLQVIQKLDKRRRQVFVQAVIAEISLDKLKNIGTQLSLSGGGVSGNTGLAGVMDPFNFLSTSADPQQAAIATVLKGLLPFSNVQIGGVIKALQSSSAINVLSTPNIMTSDNKEAEIFVGENVPFLTQSNVITGGISQQSIERRDTGITLKITPQISEGEYVKLDIYQEISAVTSNKGQATDLVTTKRSAKTSVVVKDKDTVVIGGLIQDQENKTEAKIPILGDIPLLGWLFKTRSTERTKTNLMILLTPRIIRGAKELSEVSEKQKTLFTDMVQSDQPFNLGRELDQKP
jgi:general secretion pathway protein D